MSFIIGIFLGVVGVTFAFQNLDAVTVSFFNWNFEGSVALIVITSILIGVVISLLFSLSGALSGMMKESKLKRQNKALEQELEEHKEMLNQAHQNNMDIDKVVIVEEDSTKE